MNISSLLLSFAIGVALTLAICLDFIVIPSNEGIHENALNECTSYCFEFGDAITLKYDMIYAERDITWEEFTQDSDFILKLSKVWDWEQCLHGQPQAVLDLF